MGLTHHSYHINEHVRLRTDVPYLGLHCGESGSVCSIWFSPTSAIEVEFLQQGQGCPIRAILLESQIEADEAS